MFTLSLSVCQHNSKSILTSGLIHTQRSLPLSRFYSSQGVRHLFTQQQEIKSGPEAAVEEAESGVTKKWSKHVMPSQSILKEQVKQEEEEEANREASHRTRRKKRRRRELKPLKAVLTLTPNALLHLRKLMDQPVPKLIRVSVNNRGCSGLTYNLEYVTKPEKFDEEVIQDGVKILVDSKALFSIIGSEMDWVDNKLASKFVFKNPNSKGTCGCGESFMV
ncbi:hypothetical protein FOA43_001516 [Brettanomyces nanus]|uniref:Iron-sulfur assembly protein 1 n=1 Tax=Eeniella nana TaxID=13502 RepID=A0A875S278_EENNA|nr:uncharacterized protein FOA43_001516 [Brettanomyces nanus]QPG74192.1 hypothetical protein FOA43_001516 [Brettanomyces nanus]